MEEIVNLRSFIVDPYPLLLLFDKINSMEEDVRELEGVKNESKDEEKWKVRLESGVAPIIERLKSLRRGFLWGPGCSD
jgi:hypothetical protein